MLSQSRRLRVVGVCQEIKAVLDNFLTELRVRYGVVDLKAANDSQVRSVVFLTFLDRTGPDLRLE
jgi:hypothetical protein